METRISVPFVIAMVFAANFARADDYSWNSATGGSFQEPTNWLGPVAPPGAGDAAIFDLDATYEVDFDSSVTNSAALVGAGHVTLDLQGHTYRAGLCVGIDCVSAQFVPRGLTIVNGTFDAGSVIVDDADLRVAAAELTSALITLGYAFSGTLEVLEGSVVVNDGAVLAVNQSSDAHVLIDGSGSQWIVFEHLTVGEDGDASVRVQNGGFLLTGQATVAEYTLQTNCCGSVEVSGVGSTWINASNLVLGGAVFGRLRVEDGGLATTRNAVLGLQSFLWEIDRAGDGTVVVDGPGSLFRVSEAMILGGSGDPDPGGFGHLLISNEGRAAVGEQMLLRNDADVDVQSGGLDIGSLAATALPGEVRVHEAGFLGGTGSILGSLRLAGGVDPGGASGGPGNVDIIEFFLGPPRLLQIEGDFTAEGTASLTFDIAGAPVSGSGEDYDAVQVGGTAQLGGELVLNVSSAIASDLGPGDVFTVLTAAGLSGGFANVPSGGWLPEGSGQGSFQVFYGPGSPFGANVVALTGFNSPACSDGLDNDGDGYTDYPEDPGCQNADSKIERTQCQDGLNNDFSPGIDFDGGASLNGGVPISTADPQCVGKPWRNTEAGAAACGLGFEVTLGLLPLAWARRRRERSRDRLRR